jgi:hypothetical protein
MQDFKSKSIKISGKRFSILMEIIWDFWVNGLHFAVMAVSKYAWIRYAIYLRNLLLSHIILTIAKFGVENAWKYTEYVFFKSQ